MQTFADMMGGGVSGMQTSAFLEKVLEGLRSQKNFSKCKNESVDVCIPETPPPLMSANVCNWVPPNPLKIADVLF